MSLSICYCEHLRRCYQTVLPCFRLQRRRQLYQTLNSNSLPFSTRLGIESPPWSTSVCRLPLRGAVGAYRLHSGLQAHASLAEETPEEVRRAEASFNAVRRKGYLGTPASQTNVLLDRKLDKRIPSSNRSLSPSNGNTDFPPSKSTKRGKHEIQETAKRQEAPANAEHNGSGLMLEGDQSVILLDDGPHEHSTRPSLHQKAPQQPQQQTPSTACREYARSHYDIANNPKAQAETAHERNAEDAEKITIPAQESLEHLALGLVRYETVGRSKGTRKTFKKCICTPSKGLLFSLGPLAPLYAGFRDLKRKVDLSHKDPMVIAQHGGGRVQQKEPSSFEVKSHQVIFATPQLCLQRILAEYMHSCWPIEMAIVDPLRGPRMTLSTEESLRLVFTDENSMYLQSQGYQPEDLASWAWILTAISTERAVGRLLALTEESSKDDMSCRSIPSFVFMFLLRREHWSAPALLRMIVHAWDRLEGRVASRKNQSSHPCGDEQLQNYGSPQSQRILHQALSESTVVIMVVRLLRQARKVLPEACIPIAAMLTRYVKGHDWGSTTASRKTPSVIRLTFIYNSILSLLALPASLSPFLSVPAQQAAQFNVLRRMNEFHPPLAIDREGYRAVTRVQIAHKKTFQERDWASLKAKSWPPWKEDKLGIDVEKGPQYGMSRASQIKEQLQAAGYALQRWEVSADILAGWDTDNSPTIQQRYWLSRPPKSRRSDLEAADESPEYDTNIWAARVRATRTIDEAWACFLAYKDTLKGKVPTARFREIYFAMFEKLVYDQRRLRNKNAREVTVDAPTATENYPLPGDGKEVSEKPGPREAIYVRSSPPDIDDFFNTMLQEKVYITPRFLAFLLIHANSFRIGVYYLNRSHLPPTLVQGLLTGDATIIQDVKHKKRMPSYLFSAFIAFLCRFAPHSSYKARLPQLYLPRLQLPRSAWPRVNSLTLACQLMDVCKPYHRPAWNAILAALARKGVLVQPVSSGANDRIQDVAAWSLIRSTVDQMRRTSVGLDLACFRSVCVGYEKALLANSELNESASSSVLGKCSDSGSRPHLSDGILYLKSLFLGVVSVTPDKWLGRKSDMGISNAEKHIPRLLEVPHPAQLHAFIRVLGLRKDNEGLLELLEWMACYSPEIQGVAEEAMNGKRLLKRCLVAIRVFLEVDVVASDQQLRDQNERNCMSFPDDDEYNAAMLHLRLRGVPDEELAQRHYAQRCQEVIESNPEWGGWPNDEEVDEYLYR